MGHRSSLGIFLIGSGLSSLYKHFNGQLQIGKRETANGKQFARFEINHDLASPAFSLPFAFCLLPFAFCLLPFAFCLLPSAYFTSFNNLSNT
jgi:hypothetical protein